jgi:hypothetical protein
MKIVEQSNDRLVLEIRPVGLMILCIGLFLLFLIIGFGSHLFIPTLAGWLGFPDWMVGASANAPKAPGMNLLGYASVIPLAVGIFLIKTRRLTFDRPSGQIKVSARGMLGSSEKSYPLSAFQGASLAASRSGNSGTSYRAMLHFSDANAIVSVTPYGTSGSGPAKTVNAINAWLGAPGSGPSVTLSGNQAEQVLAALAQAGIQVRR